MPLSAFPWPGGKTHYISKILPYFPNHRRYVEPFGGSAAVLLNKPKSYVEVFNDLDDDVVHFFETVREQREELQEWLRAVPYSESQYEDWQDDYFEGHRPDDDVERAGRWFYLRCTTYGGSADRRAGFKRPGKRNEARSFRGNVDNLEAVVDRFQEVTIANEDYRQILDRYDHDETLFYIDPPYVDVGERYYPAADGFDFGEFVDALRDRDGYWIVSSGDLPDGLGDVATETREFTARYSLPNANSEQREEATEHLSMNFDPNEVPEFLGPQRTLATATDGGNERTLHTDTDEDDDREIRTDGGIDSSEQCIPVTIDGARVPAMQVDRFDGDVIVNVDVASAVSEGFDFAGIWRCKRVTVSIGGREFAATITACSVEHGIAAIRLTDREPVTTDGGDSR